MFQGSRFIELGFTACWDSGLRVQALSPNLDKVYKGFTRLLRGEILHSRNNPSSQKSG